MAIANTTLLLKKSATPGIAPTALANGEIAINYADGKLFYKNNVGSITAFSSGTPTNSFATVNSNSSLILATSPTDTLSIIPGNNITISTNSTLKTITINSTTASGSGSSSNSFSTILVSGQPNIIANTSTSSLTLVAGSGINITTVGTSNTITISSTGGFSGGSIANQLIVANTISSFSNSNNALQVSGGVGVANSVYVGNRVGFGNTSTSLAYTTYNSTFNSIDTIFG